MMKFQMYVAKISKNHPSSTRFVGKKEKENPIIPFHDPFSLSTPNYRSVAVHRDPRAGIPSWKLSMHLQTWLLLSRHQIHQSILQWHRYRGRIRKVDDGEFPSFFFFSLWNTFAKIPSVYFLLVKLQLLKILFAKKIRFNDDLSTVLNFRNSIERSSSTQFYLEICNEEKKKENVQSEFRACKVLFWELWKFLLIQVV